MVPDLYPRQRLIQAPTPLHRLDRLSAELGIELWIKRDDLTGFAGGGNKGRKLEYLMADALERGAEAVVTCGGLQSNFIRQLGAACAMFDMRCIAAVMEHPRGSSGPLPAGVYARPVGGNVLLDSIVGVELVRFEDDDWEVLYAHADQLADGLEAEGVRCYRIPVGGSSAMGAYAFYRAAHEAMEQSGLFDVIVCPTSSGSTHAGLSVASFGTKTQVIGISCDPEDLVEDLFALVGDLEALVRPDPMMTVADLDVRTEFCGPAYGAATNAGVEAIRLLASREGIYLDPIYSAKAFSGLLALARRGELAGKRTLFWHTGGLPGLLAFDQDAFIQMVEG